MRILKHCILSMILAAGAANAQIRLPALPLPTLPLQTLPQTLGQIQAQTSDQLSELRRLEVGRLIRANRRVVDTDQNGDPIVRNEILGLSLADAAVVGSPAQPVKEFFRHVATLRRLVREATSRQLGNICQ